ncbi:hypothetical protein FNV43_RR18984 [Rhamnella rubrinervis]|uniref:Uncharacterized protein n=1 Tax=Rhamnella rubrinervis TaxID=2594499 RepID=A0A8K0GWU6_9ROSA|nr:hypothetical protein FNV43_RR18984 [Rhamnella rubrinervis]
MTHALIELNSMELEQGSMTNEFVGVEDIEFKEVPTWGTYAMILPFQSPSKMEGKHKTSYDLYGFLLHFDVGLSCDTHGSMMTFRAFLSDIKDARIPIPQHPTL